MRYNLQTLQRLATDGEPEKDFQHDPEGHPSKPPAACAPLRVHPWPGVLNGGFAVTTADVKCRFEARLLRPAKPAGDRSWTFVVLPREASEQLPRRGRTTVAGKLNGHPFQATLEPDGQLSHWLQVSSTLQEAAGAAAGDVVTLELAPVASEPEPEIPADLQAALAAIPRACEVWNATTTIARVDWIHWITSAKQLKTREKRIADACDMLASGKKRVCCFDQSGYYSKAFRAPEAEDS